MKKSIIIAAATAVSAILLAASCQKQEEPKLKNEGKTFTAVISQEFTKTILTSEYKVNWEEGDLIDINSGSIFSATPDATDATKASFTKVSGSDPDGEYGYTAVYPASIMVETTPTLPATQTYIEGKFNAPMCAMSSTESLEFMNFCGVLCFALKGTDKVKSITVTANEQLCGPFEFSDATAICFTDENVGKTVTLDCGTEGVQLDETTATNFYIYLPPSTYTSGMKMTITNTDGEVYKKTTTSAAEIERSNVYTFNWTPEFAAVLELPGEFTIGEGNRTVKFSRGNLYWDGDSFEFEANQYTVGTWNATNHVNYFFWSKTQSVATATSYSDESTAAADDVLFTNVPDFTVGGETGFRTLSADEWTYLLATRDGAANLLAEDVTVCGVEHCLVIAPDACLNDFVFDKTKKSYDAAAWATAEAAGLICLPPAGYRDGTEIKSDEGKGFYWASTTDATDKASNLGFKKSDN